MTPNQMYNTAWIAHIELRVWLKDNYPELSYEELWEVMIKIMGEDESKLNYKEIVDEAKQFSDKRGPIMQWIKENYPNANLAKVKI
jgi:hypothetical protein